MGAVLAVLLQGLLHLSLLLLIELAVAILIEALDEILVSGALRTIAAGALGAALAMLGDELFHGSLLLLIELAVLIHIELLDETLTVRFAIAATALVTLGTLGSGGGRSRILCRKGQHSQQCNEEIVFHGYLWVRKKERFFHTHTPFFRKKHRTFTIDPASVFAKASGFAKATP